MKSNTFIRKPSAEKISHEYELIFQEPMDMTVARELAALSPAKLLDIAENNDAECSYADFSAGQIDAALSAYGI